jgi:subtilisin family serine protease
LALCRQSMWIERRSKYEMYTTRPLRSLGGPRLILCLLAALLIFSLGPPGSRAAPPLPENETHGVSPLSPTAGTTLPEPTPSPLPRNPKLDSVLALLAATARVSPAEAVAQAASRSVRVSGERVQVQIVTRPDGLENVIQALTKAGGEATGVGRDDTEIQGWLPIDALEGMAEEEDVYFIRRPIQAFPLEQLAVGGSTTEGLAVINGLAWQAAGYTGSGVKVAIIDGGFTGYRGLLGTDLPASVTAKNFVDGETDAQVDGTSEHGTACVEVIYDIAPDADIYLAKIATDVDLEEAVDWLLTQQVDIISTSLGFYNATPGDGTGYLADLVSRARQAGILWVTAAGNDRESHWGGVYYNADADSYHEFPDGGDVDCFSFDGQTCSFLFLGQFNLLMRWSDWTDVDQDFDLHLVRWNGTQWITVASSTDVQNGGPGQTPTEWIAAGLIFDFAPYGFRIERVSGVRPVNFEVFAPGLVSFGFRPLYLLHARSIANLADAPEAMTVAALDVNNLSQEFYSSEGPTNGPGGSESGGFTKPDISGLANVSTQTYGPGLFNGTSAATPHVSGAAALVLSAYPGYTPDQVQAFLEQQAIDIGDNGVDVQFGYGRLTLGDPPGQAGNPTHFIYFPSISKAGQP